MALEQTELSIKVQNAIRQAHFKQTNEIYVNEDTYSSFYDDPYLGTVYFDKGQPKTFHIGNVQVVIRNSVPNGEVHAE